MAPDERHGSDDLLISRQLIGDVLQKPSTAQLSAFEPVTRTRIY